MHSSLKTALANSSLSQATSALSAITSGWTISTLGEPTMTDHFRGTYTSRLDHLLTKSSPHAKQLAASTQEMIEALTLAQGQSVQWLVVSSDQPHQFDFLMSLSTGQVLACLKVVSQLNVSPAYWQDLWQDVV
jgi:hypothetical protein